MVHEGAGMAHHLREGLDDLDIVAGGDEARGQLGREAALQLLRPRGCATAMTLTSNEPRPALGGRLLCGTFFCVYGGFSPTDGVGRSP